MLARKLNSLCHWSNSSTQQKISQFTYHSIHSQPYIIPGIYIQQRYVQQIRKVFNTDTELNNLEEQAYGCTDNGQITRALHVFNQLIHKQPNVAKYYFDSALTIIKYETLDNKLLNEAIEKFRKSINISQSRDSYIIKTYAKALLNGVFITSDNEQFTFTKKDSINEALTLYENYCSHYLPTNDQEIDAIAIDCETLFEYGQLLDDEYHDYIKAGYIFKQCIKYAELQSKYFEVVDEYRIRYGFYLYKQQLFDEAIAILDEVIQNFNRNIEIFNHDPNENTPQDEEPKYFNTNLQKRQPRTYAHIFACIYLGQLYLDLDDYQMAKLYYNQILVYKNKYYVKNDFNMQLLILNEYILYLIKVGNYRRAYEYWLQSYRIDKQLSSNDLQINVSTVASANLSLMGICNLDILTIGAYLHSCTDDIHKADKYFNGIQDIINEYPDIYENIHKYGLQNPYYFYGLHCIKCGEYRKAKELLLSVCKKQPEFPLFLYQLSIACCGLKEFKEAYVYLQQALNMNFAMIYPKYFAVKELIFSSLPMIEIPESKRDLLEVVGQEVKLL